MTAERYPESCPELAIFARADTLFAEYLIGHLKNCVLNRDTVCRLAHILYKTGATEIALTVLSNIIR
jgi:hypothetical protein